MAAVLGKVTRATAARRGPDAKYRIVVKPDWLEAGATVEVTLARNLECAACDGGGCDACGGSGALTLRQRQDAPETIQVTLPDNPPAGVGAGTGLVLRIPDSGGRADPAAGLPRGLLLLSVSTGDQPDAHVRLCDAGQYRQAAASLVGLRHSLSKLRFTPTVLIALLLLAWILLLLAIRLTGCR